MNSLIISIGTIGTLFSCVYLGYIALDKFSIKLPNTIKGLFTVIALISLVIHTFFYMDWGSNLDNFQWWIERTILLIVFSLGISIRVHDKITANQN